MSAWLNYTVLDFTIDLHLQIVYTSIVYVFSIYVFHFTFSWFINVTPFKQGVSIVGSFLLEVTVDGSSPNLSVFVYCITSISLTTWFGKSDSIKFSWLTYSISLSYPLVGGAINTKSGVSGVSFSTWLTAS